MGNFLFNRLMRGIAVVCFAAAVPIPAEEAGLLGIYPFVDHAGMHYRTQPLVDFLRRHQVNLQLDVADTYEELLQRAMRREYLVTQVPVHFGLYLQRCCGYRIVAGWQERFSALEVALNSPVSRRDSSHPATIAVAGRLALVNLAITGQCTARTAKDETLVVFSGTHERALQALLRGQADLALISSTSILSLHPDINKRLTLVKRVDGLPSDVILVRAGTAVTPDWQWALQHEFADSAEARVFQLRWHRQHGIAPVTRLQLLQAEPYAAMLESCL
jgi:hypothetical protein